MPSDAAPLLSSNAPSLRTRLGVLLFTDIVGSTSLKTVLGSGGYATLLARHNELFETGIAEVEEARVIKHTGDGYFAEFPTASAAVRFALTFQSRMGLEPWGIHRLETRVGIHVGEMVLMEMAGQADIVGLTADLAARIMGLATGGQILMTVQAFNDARQFVAANPSELAGPPLRWLAHGRYVFKGNEEPLEVFEVGIEGFSPLQPPPDSEKAKRAVSHELEVTLGWRPAAGLEVPGRPGWKLERKLGEGGFGEVWLALRQKLHQERVFKFCFDLDRLRSFKRELTLFRLLREALGDRKDIAQLYEVKLDEAPFFLESEYTPGGSLSDWVTRNTDPVGAGGLSKMSLESRVRLVADVADAVAGAHSVGVLHKDIKPSNILVEEQKDGTLSPKLSDFGIGVLADRTALRERNITETGMTIIDDNDSSRTGTRIYSPPEMLEGKTFTVQGDVYALGVLLYQVVVGDLLRPLGVGWEREVDDPLLRSDISACVDRDLSRRLSGAKELVDRLRHIPGRGGRAAAEVAAANEARRLELGRKKLQRWTRMGVAATAVLSFASGLLTWKNSQLRAATAEAQRQRDVAISARAEAQAQTDVAKQDVKFLKDLLASADPDGGSGDKITVLEALKAAAKELDSHKLSQQPQVEAEMREVVGQTLTSLGDYSEAESLLLAAFDYRRKAASTHPLDLAESTTLLAAWYEEQSRVEEAAKLYEESLSLARSALAADDPKLWPYQINVAKRCENAKQAEEAEKILQEIRRRAKSSTPPDRDDIYVVDRLLVYLLAARGAFDDARDVFREFEAATRIQFGESSIEFADVLTAAAELEKHDRHFEAAESSLTRALTLYQGKLSNHKNVAETLGALAEVLSEEGKPAAAAVEYDKAIRIMLGKVTDQSPDSMSKTLAGLIKNATKVEIVLINEGHFVEAEALARDDLEGCERLRVLPKKSTYDRAVLLEKVLDNLEKTGEADELRRRYPAGDPSTRNAQPASRPK